MPLPIIGPELRYTALVAGTMSAVQTAGNKSDLVVCPFKGQLKFAVINPDTVIDADVTFDILINTAETANVFTLLDTSIADGGHVMAAEQVLEVPEGASLQLQSDGEQTAATTAVVTFVVERQ